MALIDKRKCGSWNYVLSAYRSFATTASQLKISDFSGETFKVLKCYTFLWMQRRHNCSPAASFANCVMTLYLLKVHPQTFLSVQITQKCPILSCDTLVANERYGLSFTTAPCTAAVSQRNPAFTRASHNSCSVHTVIKETLFAKYAVFGKAPLFTECKTWWVCNFRIYLMKKSMNKIQIYVWHFTCSTVNMLTDSVQVLFSELSITRL